MCIQVSHKCHNAGQYSNWRWQEGWVEQRFWNKWKQLEVTIGNNTGVSVWQVVIFHNAFCFNYSKFHYKQSKWLATHNIIQNITKHHIMDSTAYINILSNSMLFFCISTWSVYVTYKLLLKRSKCIILKWELCILFSTLSHLWTKDNCLHRTL